MEKVMETRKCNFCKKQFVGGVNYIYTDPYTHTKEKRTYCKSCIIKEIREELCLLSHPLWVEDFRSNSILSVLGMITSNKDVDYRIIEEMESYLYSEIESIFYTVNNDILFGVRNFCTKKAKQIYKFYKKLTKKTNGFNRKSKNQ